MDQSSQGDLREGLRWENIEDAREDIALMRTWLNQLDDISVSV